MLPNDSNPKPPSICSQPRQKRGLSRLSISLGNKPTPLGFSPNNVYIRSGQCPRLAISTWPVTTLSRSRNVKALGVVLQREHGVRPPQHPPAALSSQRLHSLQLEYVCCWLLLIRRLRGRFWTCSRASGAGKGLFPTTHVAAIKRRKGPCSRGPLLLPALSEIPLSRCYSNWTRFQSLEEGRNEGILPAAQLHPLFKW